MEKIPSHSKWWNHRNKTHDELTMISKVIWIKRCTWCHHFHFVEHWNQRILQIFVAFPDDVSAHFYPLNHLIGFSMVDFQLIQCFFVKYIKKYSRLQFGWADERKKNRNSQHVMLIRSFPFGTAAKSLRSNMANVELLSCWLSCLSRSRTMYEKCSVWYEWARKNDSKLNVI